MSNPDYRDDLESDFSVFHRVDDMYALDPGTFFSRAQRLQAYSGALAATAQREQAPQASVPSESTKDVEPDIEALRNAARQKEFGTLWDGVVNEHDFDSPGGRKAFLGVVD